MNLTNKGPSPWFSVYVTHSPPEAYIVQGRLEAHGIMAMVHAVPGAAAMGIHIGRLGEIQVVVNAADYEQAMAILYPDEDEALPSDTNPINYIDRDETEDDDDEWHID